MFQHGFVDEDCCLCLIMVQSACQVSSNGIDDTQESVLLMTEQRQLPLPLHLKGEVRDGAPGEGHAPRGPGGSSQPQQVLQGPRRLELGADAAHGSVEHRAVPAPPSPPQVDEQRDCPPERQQNVWRSLGTHLRVLCTFSSTWLLCGFTGIAAIIARTSAAVAAWCRDSSEVISNLFLPKPAKLLHNIA